MGKAQSKRSVDITTETKKGAEDEITEKMEKIEDIDKKDVVNGDATNQEKNESEKKDTEDVENDKDMTTEKNVDAEASGDSSEQNKSNAADPPKEDGSAIVEEISPLSDESIKKSKKEKVKKKWSFRSISFGKKDKQKPAKNEETAEDGAVSANGAADEKTSPETEESQPSVNVADEKSTENHENGNATEQELNGEQTEAKSTEEKANEVSANTTIITATTETSSPVQIDTAVSTEKTEKTAIAKMVTIDDEATQSGNGISEETNATEQEATDATESVEAPSENKNSLAEVTTESSASTTNGDFDKVHQNGTNAENEVEQPKAQIEVNSNTDNKASAATLDFIPSTSIIPPNVQVQDFNESSENPDNNVVQIEDAVVHDEEQTNKKSIGVENSVLLQDFSPTTLKESADKADIDDDNETVVLSSEQPANTERSSDINMSDEPSPPPLPISPPPSQVSMFAFTNNEESDEASIQVEKSEPEPSSIINTHVEEVEKNDVAIVPCTTNATELSKDITDEVIENHPFISNENDTEEVVVKNRTENKDSDDITDQADVNQFVLVEANECEYEKMQLNNDDAISTTAGDISEKLNEDESSLAAAVVDEITEKAVEIVNQQLQSSDEPVRTELLEHKDEQQLSLDASEEEQATEGFSCNIEDTFNNTLAHITTITTTNDTDAVLCEKPNISQESPIVLQTTNDTDKDCSLALLSAPETVKQPEDVEMISSNKSDSLDAILEEHFNPTKEFANAKDLKENVAVAEITQDTSVTCE